MSIELPPAPASVEEAIRKANAIAYGFEKHTDPSYWVPPRMASGGGYYGDPVYFWKRMLGWQAGDNDRARAGLYANPPTDWLTDPVAPPVPPQPPAPPTDGGGEDDGGTDFDLVAFLARLNELEANIVKLETLLTDVKNRPWPTYTGKLLGYTITLAPKANA